MNMEELKRLNSAIGHHFFDLKTLQFFDSKIESEIIGDRFFVTSEKPSHGKRAYTVRRFTIDGKVYTEGQFQEFATKQQAIKRIQELLCTPQ